MICLYRLSSGRQLVYDRYIEIAVYGHRQRARYGRSGHYEDVRRLDILRPEFCPLSHTEAMLFVDDDKTEISEFYLVFYQGVRTDNYIKLAVFEHTVYLVAVFFLCRADKQPHIYAQPLGKTGDTGVVLGGEYLCGSHYARLETIVDSDKRRQKCHDSFTATHVALQQAIHLSAAFEVGVYLFYHSFLGFGKREWQIVFIKIIEMNTYSVHNKSLGLLLPCHRLP